MPDKIAAKFDITAFAREHCPRKTLDEDGRHAADCRSCADLKRILETLVKNMGIKSA